MPNHPEVKVGWRLGIHRFLYETINLGGGTSLLVMNCGSSIYLIFYKELLCACSWFLSVQKYRSVVCGHLRLVTILVITMKLKGLNQECKQ